MALDDTYDSEIYLSLTISKFGPFILIHYTILPKGAFGNDE
jgi:hypothetical protein